MFFKKKYDYDDKFDIKIGGLIKLNKEKNIPDQIIITKQVFSGDYYTIVNTLFHYAATAYLRTEENPTRGDFNEWANKAYIETVSGGNLDDR